MKATQLAIRATVVILSFAICLGISIAQQKTPSEESPKAPSPIDPAVAKRLTEAIAKVESAATTLAKHAQSLSQLGKLGASPEAAEMHQKLEKALVQAFELKCELEQVRIQELQSRLSALEQQIGQRKLQRQQIVDRRIRELMESDGTAWNVEPTKEVSPSADHVRAKTESNSELSSTPSADPYPDAVKKEVGNRQAEMVAHDPYQVQEDRSRGSQSKVMPRDTDGAVSPDELASKVLRARDELIEAEDKLARSNAGMLERDSLPVATSRRDNAQRRVAITEEAFKVGMSDTMLQMEIAKEESDQAREMAHIREEAYRNKSISKILVMDQNLRFHQAEAKFRRLNSQFMLYEKINRQLFAAEKQ